MESIIMDIMGNVEYYYGYHGQCGVLLWISWAMWSIIMDHEQIWSIIMWSIILDIVGKYGTKW